MAIKFTALRTHDGHAVDPTRPEAVVKAGVGGYFDLLATDRADSFRVTVNGKDSPARKWPTDLKPGKHAVRFQQIRGGNVVDTKDGEVEVVGATEPDKTPIDSQDGTDAPPTLEDLHQLKLSRPAEDERNTEPQGGA